MSMGTIYGIQLQLNPFPRMRTREVRVPGGYKNRWLVRAFVQVPIREMIHDRMRNVIYCDAESMQEIRRAAVRNGVVQ